MSTTESITINFNIPQLHFGDLHYFEYDLNFALEALRALVQSQETVLIERRKKLASEIEKDSDYHSITDEYVQAQYYWNYYEPTETTINDLQNLFRTSSILMAFTVFESRLASLCDMIESETQIPFIASNKKSPAHGLVKYIKKDFGITAVSSNVHYGRIEQYRLIRNQLTHSSRSLSATEALELKSFSHVEIDKFTGGIKITSADLALDLIRQIELYFKDLVSEVDARIKALQPAGTT